MLDFTIAKMKHQLWKRKLYNYINKNEPIDEQEMVSEKDCQLGKWLYSEGMEKYKSISEINTLEQVHSKLHKLTFSIVSEKKSENIDQARQMLDELSGVSEEIVGLLDKLEVRVKHA